MKRRTFLALVGTILLGGGAVVTRQALEGAPDTRYELLQMVNKRRVAHERRALRASSALMTTATKHAQYMATHQELVHSHLQLPPGADWVGEIIGVGSDFNSVMKAWLHSPEHRQILLSPGSRYAGTGVAYQERWWLVVQFSH